MTSSEIADSRRASGEVGRRTVLMGAALSIPAVTVMVSTPAWAASGGSVSLSAPDMRVPAAGNVPVTALVRDAASQPVAGTAVSFSGPSGASFSPTSGVTDGSGKTTTQLDLGTPWATPGSSATLTAVTSAASTSAAFTVVGSNLVAAGREYARSVAQTELVFPSPVTDAIAAVADLVRVNSPDNSVAWFLALLADGTVWAKGGNAYGQLGDGSTTDRSTWAPVPGLAGVTQIAAADRSGYALLSDGSVRAWGDNRYGQLGIGSTTNQLTPVAVTGLTSRITQIIAGYDHVVASASDGSLVSWGRNALGQVGDGSTTDRWAPVPVSGLTGVAQIATAYNSSFALLTDGSVRSWGDNAYGILGIGTREPQKSSPVPVPTLASGVTQIAGGGWSAYALLSDGSVRSWGMNGVGQLGDGSTTDRYSPGAVTGLTSGVTQIAAGTTTAYVLRADGTMNAWGQNDKGQVGDGSTARRRLTPVAVPLPTGREVRRLASLSTTSQTALAVMKTS